VGCNEIFAAIAKGIAPDPYLTIDEWADRFRKLPKGASAEAGQYRTDRMPYLREIMRELSPQSPVQQVKVMKGTQLGFTEVANNVAMYYMDIVPSSQLMIMPTETLAKDHSNRKLTPSLRAMPDLAKRISGGKTKDDIGGTFEKIYPGGMLKIAWAGSPANFRSLSCRVVLLDDVDGFPFDVDGEGSPLDLAKKRTDSFGILRKIYINSTPTVDGASNIQSEFEASDQRHYYMPCPHCREKILFERDGFVYETDGENGEIVGGVRYRCPECGGMIEERMKTKMLHAGEWIPHRPGHRHRGYRLPAYYSPVGFLGWDDIFSEYEEAKRLADEGDNTKMKSWSNTRDANVWKEEISATDTDSIVNLAIEFPEGCVPPRTAFTTMTVDVQLDHFWYQVSAWRYGGGKHTLRYGRCETWSDIEEVFSVRYYSDAGEMFAVRRVAIDAGYRTDEVYEFCAMHSDICVPVKGVETQRQPWRVSDVTQKKGARTVKTGLKLYLIDTTYYKDRLDARIKRSLARFDEGTLDTADNAITLHSATGPDFARQMTSEYKAEELNKKTGKVKYFWKKVTRNADNHLWDCAVYDEFLSDMLGIGFLKDENAVVNVRRGRRVYSKGISR